MNYTPFERGTLQDLLIALKGGLAPGIGYELLNSILGGAQTRVANNVARRQYLSDRAHQEDLENKAARVERVGGLQDYLIQQAMGGMPYEGALAIANAYSHGPNLLPRLEDTLQGMYPGGGVAPEPTWGAVGSQYGGAGAAWANPPEQGMTQGTMDMQSPAYIPDPMEALQMASAVADENYTELERQHNIKMWPYEERQAAADLENAQMGQYPAVEDPAVIAQLPGITQALALGASEDEIYQEIMGRIQQQYEYLFMQKDEDGQPVEGPDGQPVFDFTQQAVIEADPRFAQIVQLRNYYLDPAVQGQLMQLIINTKASLEQEGFALQPGVGNPEIPSITPEDIAMATGPSSYSLPPRGPQGAPPQYQTPSTYAIGSFRR